MTAQESFPIKHWTMTHSFFAGMGGYAINTRCESSDKSGRVAVRGDGILLLARQGHLPDLSMEMISDKSKADSLAKTLVCVQAGWLVVQCIARLVTGLPVTLLEVVTLAHCLCTLGMYMLWWHKPLDILEPVVLDHLYLQRGEGITGSGHERWNLFPGPNCPNCPNNDTRNRYEFNQAISRSANWSTDQGSYFAEILMAASDDD
jgi:hypothetical protein